MMLFCTTRLAIPPPAFANVMPLSLATHVLFDIVRRRSVTPRPSFWPRMHARVLTTMLFLIWTVPMDDFLGASNDTAMPSALPRLSPCAAGHDFAASDR